MYHEQYLKIMTSERRGGKMVDVSFASVCRCGARFHSDAELVAHVRQPLAPMQRGPESPGPADPPENVYSKFSLVP